MHFFPFKNKHWLKEFIIINFFEDDLIIIA